MQSIILNNIRLLASRVCQRLPCRCLLCRGSAADALCPACLRALPWLTTATCPVCAQPSPGGGHCGHCLSKPPAFAACHALFAYQPPLSELILAGKYGQRWSLWPLLGTLMAAHAPRLQQQAVLLPMPLHASRLRERGFNQAQELASAIAQHSGLPLELGWLARRRDTGHQSRLSRRERERNLRQAFSTSPAVAGREIVLIDDVLTSGATLDAAARALLTAGASRVSGWVLARTLAQAYPPSDSAANNQ
ncbi:ComF family protein [Chitinilyticum piscinae]|uniref:ComF family protein n=1 Tax=Chitinilyticum piscinae TaxID=2866724 RepID=A0A8J7K2N8_9NEIS|nr:ComF family protein [Chitinilyticum piscinae]MBE9610736.1 ComF family protein [Chitinilyticum piscinae]